MLPIGHRIRSRRKELRLTQSELAEQLGISASYVNLIEHDKRVINGALLHRFAEALNLEPASLDGMAERRLLQEIGEVAAEPELAALDLGEDKARALIAQHSDWAEAITTLRRARAQDRRIIAALSDRLNHDPTLNEYVHQMLSSAAALRSASDILAETPDLNTQERARFDAIIKEEGKRIAEVSSSLAGTFDGAALRSAGWSAMEEVDDFLINNRNHFPTLEDAAADFGLPVSVSDTNLAELLEDRHGVDIKFLENAEGTARSYFDASSKTLFLARWANRASRRFATMRCLAGLEAAPAIDDIVVQSTEPTTATARQRARGALLSYVAAAALMPYDTFYEQAETNRYDIDALTIAFSVSPEQTCHRFTTLRREGQEGVPFAMVRANASGYLTKRFTLPRLPIPRYGGACPLWALYTASQTPDTRVRQIAEFPGGERFFLLARTTRPAALTFGQSRPAHTLMLACDIVHADRLVYSDGLDLKAPGEQVGPACMLCPRTDCAHRQEEQMRDTTIPV